MWRCVFVECDGGLRDLHGVDRRQRQRCIRGRSKYGGVGGSSGGLLGSAAEVGIALVDDGGLQILVGLTFVIELARQDGNFVSQGD